MSRRQDNLKHAEKINIRRLTPKPTDYRSITSEMCQIRTVHSVALKPGLQALQTVISPRAYLPFCSPTLLLKDPLQTC